MNRFVGVKILFNNFHFFYWKPCSSQYRLSRLRSLRSVMSFSIRGSYELNTANLSEQLHDLVDWQLFAVFLEGITQPDIEIVKSNNPHNVVNQRTALFDLWLRRCPNPSWDHVITALNKAKEHKLAQRIRETALDELDDSLGARPQKVVFPDSPAILSSVAPGLEPDSSDDKFPTIPLCMASQNGHLDVVERLLNAGANPNEKSHKRGDHGATPLYLASQNGHSDIVKRLLQAKANPDTPLDNGATPLFIASHHGHSKVVEMLLQAKANPDTPRDDGTTPLYIASQEGHSEVVERLLLAKADPDTPRDTGATPLFMASLNGHSKVVEKLLQARANPDVQVDDGATPLFVASLQGDFKVVEVLLRARANPDIPTKKRRMDSTACFYPS